jgi:hypothetical protein
VKILANDQHDIKVSVFAVQRERAQMGPEGQSMPVESDTARKLGRRGNETVEEMKSIQGGRDSL